MKLIHERAGSAALLAGLMAVLNAACGAGEDAAKPTLAARSPLTTHHVSGAAVPLLDRAGNAIAVGSTTPYSPQRTCGGCHDVSVITKGYHFQQGSQVVADNYNPSKPWLLSDGMYGKW